MARVRRALWLAWLAPTAAQGTHGEGACADGVSMLQQAKTVDLALLTGSATCPEGYRAVPGDIPGWDQYGREMDNRKDTIDLCAADCTQRPDCLSFEWSASSTICSLNKARYPELGSFEDYMFCQRTGDVSMTPDVVAHDSKPGVSPRVTDDLIIRDHDPGKETLLEQSRGLANIRESATAGTESGQGEVAGQDGDKKAGQQAKADVEVTGSAEASKEVSQKAEDHAQRDKADKEAAEEAGKKGGQSADSNAKAGQSAEADKETIQMNKTNTEVSQGQETGTIADQGADSNEKADRSAEADKEALQTSKTDTEVSQGQEAGTMASQGAEADAKADQKVEAGKGAIQTNKTDTEVGQGQEAGEMAGQGAEADEKAHQMAEAGKEVIQTNKTDTEVSQGQEAGNKAGESAEADKEAIQMSKTDAEVHQGQEAGTVAGQGSEADEKADQKVKADKEAIQTNKSDTEVSQGQEAGTMAGQGAEADEKADQKVKADKEAIQTNKTDTEVSQGQEAGTVAGQGSEAEEKADQKVEADKEAIQTNKTDTEVSQGQEAGKKAGQGAETDKKAGQMAEAGKEAIQANETNTKDGQGEAEEKAGQSSEADKADSQKNKTDTEVSQGKEAINEADQSAEAEVSQKAAKASTQTTEANTEVSQKAEADESTPKTTVEKEVSLGAKGGAGTMQEINSNEESQKVDADSDLNQAAKVVSQRAQADDGESLKSNAHIEVSQGVIAGNLASQKTEADTGASQAIKTDKEASHNADASAQGGEVDQQVRADKEASQPAKTEADIAEANMEASHQTVNLASAGKSHAGADAEEWWKDDEDDEENDQSAAVEQKSKSQGTATAKPEDASTHGAFEDQDHDKVNESAATGEQARQALMEAKPDDVATGGQEQKGEQKQEEDKENDNHEDSRRLIAEHVEEKMATEVEEGHGHQEGQEQKGEHETVLEDVEAKRISMEQKAAAKQTPADDSHEDVPKREVGDTGPTQAEQEKELGQEATEDENAKRMPVEAKVVLHGVSESEASSKSLAEDATQEAESREQDRGARSDQDEKQRITKENADNEAMALALEMKNKVEEVLRVYRERGLLSATFEDEMLNRLVDQVANHTADEFLHNATAEAQLALSAAPESVGQTLAQESQGVRKDGEPSNSTCPEGFQYLLGDVAGWDQFGRGRSNHMGSLQECCEDCNTRLDCLSFEWSPTSKICSLNKLASPSLMQYQDYIFCQRKELIQASSGIPTEGAVQTVAEAARSTKSLLETRGAETHQGAAEVEGSKVATGLGAEQNTAKEQEQQHNPEAPLLVAATRQKPARVLDRRIIEEHNTRFSAKEQTVTIQESRVEQKAVQEVQQEGAATTNAAAEQIREQAMQRRRQKEEGAAKRRTTKAAQKSELLTKQKKAKEAEEARKKAEEAQRLLEEQERKLEALKSEREKIERELKKQKDMELKKQEELNKVKAEWTPGKYRILLDDVPVGAKAGRSRMSIAHLAAGTEITITEVSDGLVDGRIRARLARPAGWISLFHPGSNIRFAAKVTE